MVNKIKLFKALSHGGIGASAVILLLYCKMNLAHILFCVCFLVFILIMWAIILNKKI